MYPRDGARGGSSDERTDALFALHRPAGEGAVCCLHGVGGGIVKSAMVMLV
jgi:hypothetical protein